MQAKLKISGRKSPVAVIWAGLVFIVSIILMVTGGIRMITSFFPGEGTGPVSSFITGLLVTGGGVIIFIRYIKLWLSLFKDNDLKRARDTMGLDIIQAILLIVLASVLFPVIWIISMSLDPRDLSRPEGLSIIPPGASLEAYKKVLIQPSPNPVSFLRLLGNSMVVAGGTAFFSIVIGTTAAYAFSRLKFPGRKAGMLGFVIVLMIPPGGTLAPLFILLNSIKIRGTLLGLMIAFTSSALPFAIWNMKGFIDSLPLALEEAAQIDGCSRLTAFVRVVLPVAAPGIVVTGLWGFLTGWSEFILSWTFLNDPGTFTLPMVLRGMVGQYSSGTPWSRFSAMAILISIPPILLFFLLQKYLVGGLSMGSVKG